LNLLEHVVSLAIVDDLRGEETDAGMPVLSVVPGEEEVRKRVAFLDGTKAVREIGPVLAASMAAVVGLHRTVRK
jgi:hypothetical protein